ncbi:hypothetical protein BS17DRAFT_808053 [Gyrodon lividus]|nr:hypothetical protein BS17DRAFT_808053 [Gyrodon lividus]
MSTVTSAAQWSYYSNPKTLQRNGKETLSPAFSARHIHISTNECCSSTARLITRLRKQLPRYGRGSMQEDKIMETNKQLRVPPGRLTKMYITTTHFWKLSLLQLLVGQIFPDQNLADMVYKHHLWVCQNLGISEGCCTAYSIISPKLSDIKKSTSTSFDVPLVLDSPEDAYTWD